MALDFQHRYVPATQPGQPALLLLHGTGGDENDLIPLGHGIAPGAALLSPRGQVLEHGMPRFFGRLAEGVFDPAEVRRRAHALADFVVAAGREYRLASLPVAIGFSNGANVAAAVLALRPGVLAGAVLLRPMTVLDDPASGLEGTRVLMISGADDPIVSAASAAHLASLLRTGGAELRHDTLSTGHGLIQQDLILARDWLQAGHVGPGPD